MPDCVADSWNRDDQAMQQSAEFPIILLGVDETSFRGVQFVKRDDRRPSFSSRLMEFLGAVADQ